MTKPTQKENFITKKDLFFDTNNLLSNQAFLNSRALDPFISDHDDVCDYSQPRFGWVRKLSSAKLLTNCWC